MEQFKIFRLVTLAQFQFMIEYIGIYIYIG